MRSYFAVPGFALLLVVSASGCNSPTACSEACADGTVCSSGACVPVSADDLAGITGVDMAMVAIGCSPACAAGSYCNAALKCVQCLSDDNCPLGQECQTTLNGGTCVSGCQTDDRCRGDGGSSMSCCSGMCTDTTADTNNCGGCGKVCSSLNGAATCLNGVCAANACNPGYGDCNMNPADGCEANFHVDPNNCTGCNMVCALPNAIAACSDGCYIAACQFGWDDCDGTVANGCETSVLSDPKNCGACGMPCANVAHAIVGCSDGACLVNSCAVGYSDCNQMAADGCETQVATDAKNCGACGNVCGLGLVCVNGGCTCQMCNIPNSKTACVNNVCTFLSCIAGYADCNNNVADGCEVNLNTDANNCGACGTVCPNNLPHCESGACSLAPQLVGMFNVINGPAWGGNPPCYTCQGACALLFGGNAADYSCSTVMGSVNHMANTTIWGVGGCAVVADTYDKGVNYDCGVANCAQSAYTMDNCTAVNYCYK